MRCIYVGRASARARVCSHCTAQRHKLARRCAQRERAIAVEWYSGGGRVGNRAHGRPVRLALWVRPRVRVCGFGSCLAVWLAGRLAGWLHAAGWYRSQIRNGSYDHDDYANSANIDKSVLTGAPHRDRQTGAHTHTDRKCELAPLLSLSAASLVCVRCCVAL